MFKQSAEYLSNKIKSAIDKLDDSLINSVIESFFECNKIFIYGIGRSGLASKGFAMRMMHLGFRIYVIDESISPPVNTGDMIILVSGSGKTSSVLKIAQLSREIGAHLVSITAEENSPLAMMSDMTIILNIYEDKDAKLAPLGTLFEDGTIIFFDALVAEMLVRMDENEERMTARHASLE